MQVHWFRWVSSFSFKQDFSLWGGFVGIPWVHFSFFSLLPILAQRGKTDHGGGSGSRAPRTVAFSLAEKARSSSIMPGQPGHVRKVRVYKAFLHQDVDGALKSFDEVSPLSRMACMISSAIALQAIRLANDRPYVLYDARAFVYEKLNCLGGALSDAKRTIDIVPAQRQGYFRSARLLVAFDTPDEALDTCSKALLHLSRGLKHESHRRELRLEVRPNCHILGVRRTTLSFTHAVHGARSRIRSPQSGVHWCSLHLQKWPSAPQDPRMGQTVARADREAQYTHIARRSPLFSSTRLSKWGPHACRNVSCASAPELKRIPFRGYGCRDVIVRTQRRHKICPPTSRGSLYVGY